MVTSIRAQSLKSVIVMRASQRRTLVIYCVSVPPDCAGQDADETFESPAKRGFGPVAKSTREVAKRHIMNDARECISGELKLAIQSGTSNFIVK